LPVHGIIFAGIQRTVELAGPIILREVQKPRFRKFVEEKLQDVATELGRQRFTKKSKKFIMRKGKRRYECRMTN